MDNAEWRRELDRLFTSASPILPATTHALFGLPGFGEVRRLDELMLAAAAELFPGPRHVVNDVELALSGAFVGRQGVLLLAGTGSMAMAEDAGGRMVRVGGWGEIFSDEGSAYWIGRRALAETSRALDGRLEAADFASGILTGLGLDGNSGSGALMDWFYGVRHLRSTVAGVARIVDRLAQSGDQTALKILEDASDHLSAHMWAIRQRANAPPSAPWSFAGSVFESCTIRDMLTRRHGHSTPPRMPPIGGGLWRAAQASGWEPDDSWIDALAASARQTGTASPGSHFGRRWEGPG